MPNVYKSVCLSAMFALNAGITQADEARTLYLEAEKGRMFAAASFKSKVLAELKSGDAVTEVEINTPWARVKFDGVEGFMAAYSLTAVKP